jgi:hypothetical protein
MGGKVGLPNAIALGHPEMSFSFLAGGTIIQLDISPAD